ncbi:SGNH/GDSL hydrolase family protein [Anaerosolibacter sp.]|uniref:SGNH/GDSL hydrolase family protein n=1 Tax=Anaerosolibacter sp. TaxID=1872527 RepID=UPI0039F03794
MKILIYSDCMSIGPEHLKPGEKYGEILQQKYKKAEVVVMGYSGQTTTEGLATIDEAKKQNADIVILGWGVNDALPRGLRRETRAKIIRSMYTLRLGQQLRLAARSLFLNPLEYAMLKLRKPYFYLRSEDTRANFVSMIEGLKLSGTKKIIVLSIAPVLNYRFVHANDYIQQYNEVLKDLWKLNNVTFLDIYAGFEQHGFEKCLDTDLFHYSALGHTIAAEKIITEIDSYINVPQGK